MTWTLPTSYKRLSDVPGTREFNIKHSKIPGRGGGFIHTPGQVGTYSEWMQPGAQERHALVVGQMQAAKEQWRALSMPGMYADERAYQAGLPAGAYLAPGTGSAAYGAATRVIPALTAQSIATRGTRTGTRSFGSAATGLAAGGSALARGGPAVGTIPGGGLATSVGGGAGGGLSAAGGLGLAGIGESLSSTGTGIINTIKQYIPVAVKVVLAVIVIKIVLWLVIGRKK